MSVPTLRWDRLGTPSFAVCAAIIRHLPPELLHWLSPRKRKLLTHLTYLAWRQAVEKRQRTAWCSPSQRYLAGVCVVHPRTIRTYLVDLQVLKLIGVKRLFFHGPSKPAGTNWYGHNSYHLAGPLLREFYRKRNLNPFTR